MKTSFVSSSFLPLLLLLVLSLSFFSTNAWTILRYSPLRQNSVFPVQTISTSIQVASAVEADNIDNIRINTNSNKEDEDNDDDDFEYVEYERLAEADFIGSEWLVGTNFNQKPNAIQETWVRLIQDETSGKKKCVWGDNSEGVWSVDAASQYVSMSKNYPWGKTIWAGVAEDYYYLQGTVRAWTYFSAAEVVGQWQSRRLGIEPDEAGVAPWFEVNDDDDEDAGMPSSASPTDDTV